MSLVFHGIITDHDLGTRDSSGYNMTIDGEHAQVPYGVIQGQAHRALVCVMIRSRRK